MTVHGDFFRAVKRKVICFGAGKSAMDLLNSKFVSAFIEQIEYFVDNDVEKQGTAITCMGRSFFVAPPERLRGEADVIVLITMLDANASNSVKLQVQELVGESVKCFLWPELFSSEELASILKEKSDDAVRLFLLNTPTFDNLGDHAIAMAERAFFRTRYKNRFVELCDRVCRHGAREMLRCISPNDLLLITGGGNFGSLYRGTNDGIYGVIENFPKNNIIVLPQSIHYGTDDAGTASLKKAKILYNDRPGLVLCARDCESYRMLGQYFPFCRRLLVPDMVLSMRWPAASMRSGIAVCLRSDKEKILPTDVTERIIGAARNMNVGMSAISNHWEGVAARNTESAVLEKLCEYSSSRCIITDRLHGMVFAAITGTPCIAIDNSYGKNRALYETWLKNIPYIHFVDAPEAENWENLIAGKLESGICEYDSAAMTVKYSPLTDYISSLKGIVADEH